MTDAATSALAPRGRLAGTLRRKGDSRPAKPVAIQKNRLTERRRDRFQRERKGRDMDLHKGPVKVRRTVFRAAQLVERLAKEGPNVEDFHIAEILRDTYSKSGQKELRDFWKDVHEYLFTMSCVGKDTHIEIVPDDE